MTEWESHVGLHLTLPRDILQADSGGTMPSNETLLHVLNTSPLAPFLRVQLQQLARSMPKLSLAEQTTLVENTVDLLVALCRTSTVASERDWLIGPDGPESETPRGLFVAAHRYIDARLDNPTLRADHIAAAIGCSRATLYRVFKRQGITVGDFVRERRPTFGMHLLQQSPDHVTVTGIALRCGFTDTGHFSKIFKRRFGVRPSDVRQAHEIPAKV